MCGDADADWFPTRRVCWPTAVLAATHALYGARHEDAPFHDGTFERWVKTRSFDFPFHYSDGVRIGLSRDEATDTTWLTGGTPSDDRDDSAE